MLFVEHDLAVFYEEYIGNTGFYYLIPTPFTAPPVAPKI